ncbi:MAG: 2-polyprenyl-3-methyl-5-hydroxy-6-metoxy-1,4-benzoquinol methylase [Verrucomicrobiales bacterium]|jgi:2-polyprenyl-3-methyl-5-hydroxy-6-metoxy-1,4-benzoquinol methylase
MAEEKNVDEPPNCEECWKTPHRPSTSRRMQLGLGVGRGEHLAINPVGHLVLPNLVCRLAPFASTDYVVAMPDDRSHITESMSKSMSLDGDITKLSDFYRSWASNYDDDVASHGYGLPSMMVRTVESALTASNPEETRLDRRVRVLDAGCGTGLVGAALADAGFEEIHGVDLSEEMIEGAQRRGIYASLEGGVDLSMEAPEHLVRSAGVVTVGGVFTVGHVAPSALSVMSTMARRGGLLVVSTRQAYLDQTNFREVVGGLIGDGTLRLLIHAEDAPYTMDSNGDYWAFEVA